MADPPGLLGQQQDPNAQQGGFMGGLLNFFKPTDFASAYYGAPNDPAVADMARARGLAAAAGAFGQAAMPVPYKGGVPLGAALGMAGGAAGTAADEFIKSRLEAAQSQLYGMQAAAAQQNIDLRKMLPQLYGVAAGAGGGQAGTTGAPGNQPPTGPAKIIAQSQGKVFDTGNPFLNLVAHYESGYRANVGTGGTDLSNNPLDDTGFPKWDGIPVTVNGKQMRSTAAGLFQITASNWHQYAPALIAAGKMKPDFSPESQIAVANAMLAANPDKGDWLKWNPNLAAAYSRGDTIKVPGQQYAQADTGTKTDATPEVAPPPKPLVPAPPAPAAPQTIEGSPVVQPGATPGLLAPWAQKYAAWKGAPPAGSAPAAAPAAPAQPVPNVPGPGGHGTPTPFARGLLAAGAPMPTPDQLPAAAPAPAPAPAPAAPAPAPAAGAPPPLVPAPAPAQQPPPVPPPAQPQPAPAGGPPGGPTPPAAVPAAQNIPPPVAPPSASAAPAIPGAPTPAQIKASQAIAMIEGMSGGQVPEWIQKQAAFPMVGPTAAATTQAQEAAGLPYKLLFEQLKPTLLKEGQIQVDPVTKRVIGNPKVIQMQTPDGTTHNILMTPNPYGDPTLQDMGIGKIGPEAEKRLTGGAEEDIKAYAKVNQDAATAAPMASQLTRMREAAPTFYTGTGAPYVHDLNKFLVSSGMAPEKADAVQGYESFIKDGGQVVREAAHQASSRAGVQELKLVGASLPSPEMSAPGLQSVLGEMQGLQDYYMNKQQAMMLYAKRPGSMGDYDNKGFESWWNANISPYAFMVMRMSPEEKTQVLSRVAGQQGGAEELARLQKQIDFAKQYNLGQF